MDTVNGDWSAVSLPRAGSGRVPFGPDASAGAMNVDIAGEVFSIRERPGEPGVYDFTWLTGPNPGYGFTLGTSDHAPLPAEYLEDEARGFLAQIDPETGYLRDS